MGSNFWLWELNETWSVPPVAEMISELNASPVFIEDSHERPSLNWYAGQHIRKIDTSLKTGWILRKNQQGFHQEDSLNGCALMKQREEWALMFCKSK